MKSKKNRKMRKRGVVQKRRLGREKVESDGVSCPQAVKWII